MSTDPEPPTSEHHRVLFVDDEAMVLRALQRMLRPLRAEWEMAFETDPARAMERLEHEPFDVVVSDMKMPKIGGEVVLDHARRFRPEAVRIILSGQADRDATLRSVACTHQYLAKPCDPDSLRAAVSRAFRLRALVSDPKVARVVNQLEALPSAPSLFARLMAILRSDRSTLAQIAQIVTRDVAMNAKVLQLVNSAFFGPPRPVTSALQAVQLLGLDTLRAVVLGLEVFSSFEGRNLRWFDIEGTWHRGLNTGLIARDIAREASLAPEVGQVAISAGLLREIGRVVLAVAFPEPYRALVEVAGSPTGVGWEMEREAFGVGHPEVGGYLLGLWGLPDLLVEAVAFHLRPVAVPMHGFDVLGVVHVAASLHDELLETDGDKRSPATIDLAYLDRVGMRGSLDRFRELAVARVGRSADV